MIDLGANTGQFARLIHRLCPEAKIISFEPLDTCQRELSDFLKDVSGSRVIQAAAGNEPGSVHMNASNFSPCSSILPDCGRLAEVSLEAAVTIPVQVPVVRVDDAVADDELTSDVLVKIDVQGFEIQAMQGAVRLLERSTIVICEVCFFRRLYEGQSLFHEIYAHLRDCGFSYMGNAEQYSRKSDGRIVEADAVFERL